MPTQLQQKGSGHATVITSGYTVPLIGIPADATQETCDRCGRSDHLSEVWLRFDGRFWCWHCRIFVQLDAVVPDFHRLPSVIR